MRFALPLIATPLVLAASVVWAQPLAPPPADAHIRGKVVSLEGQTLTVATREGPQAVIRLPTAWQTFVVKPVAASAIQPGSFIGTTEVAKPDGSGTSLEVHVFPPGVKPGEGHYAWDLKPGSMMTNGTVDTLVTGVAGRDLTVSYPGGSRKITVPDGIPIVAFGPGDKALIKPGASIFVVAKANADGTYAAGGIVTGDNGSAPPM